MLRNDLITLLAQFDNDTVTVGVNGHPVDTTTVAMRKGSITIVLEPEGPTGTDPSDIDDNVVPDG